MIRHAGYTGMDIIENVYLMLRQQFRFPRSKKRRIRKKWTKREGNVRYQPDPNLYILDKQKVTVGHPATLAQLRREVSALH